MPCFGHRALGFQGCAPCFGGRLALPSALGSQGFVGSTAGHTETKFLSIRAAFPWPSLLGFQPLGLPSPLPFQPLSPAHSAPNRSLQNMAHARSPRASGAGWAAAPVTHWHGARHWVPFYRVDGSKQTRFPFARGVGVVREVLSPHGGDIGKWECGACVLYPCRVPACLLRGFRLLGDVLASWRGDNALEGVISFG